MSIDGGQAMNAIPVYCEAVVGIEHLEDFEVFCEEIVLFYTQNYDAPDIKIDIQKYEKTEDVMSDPEALFRTILQM